MIYIAGAISDFKVSCTIKLERLVYYIVQVKLKVKLSSLFQNYSHQFNFFTFGDYFQPNRHMPGSILGIDNHLALAIDLAISSNYIPTAAAFMPGPRPFMF